jgi:acetyl-CoA acyltransferase
MAQALIVGFVRSPFAPANRGELKRLRPDDMAAQVVRGLLDQTKLNPADIEDILLGCAFPEAEQGLNLARLVGLLAELPQTVAGATVNRFCGSSMQSVHMAAGAIAMGAGDAFICAGVESMSRVPMAGFNPLPNPALYAALPAAYIGMGDTAENVAKKYQLSREEQDAFAVVSQQRAAAAQAAGRFDEELVPVTFGDTTVARDGTIRAQTTAEGLAGLGPSFSTTGTVTAGTSSPLTDGAAAVMVVSDTYADAHGLVALARIKSIAVAGCAPEIMGIGPIAATRKALKRAGIDVGDLGVIELNEAFASQSLACIRDLGLDPEKVNIDGGAIALGHPLGATGARITGKAAALLKREGAQYALATQCIGGGQGIATVLEAV